ncbi:hypothetical protein FACS189483_03030 [Spirochaetia bacterium]|nr:hypothetical protein FACS189483_03030 [Spirochaetia bacterium]
MPNGEFIVPGNTRVECEFPCPQCGGDVYGNFPITPSPHADGTATCRQCGKNYDVTITHDAGTGTITPSDGKVIPASVRAKGLPGAKAKTTHNAKPDSSPAKQEETNG